MPHKKSVRDTSQLSGRPLSETLQASNLNTPDTNEWVTSPDLFERNLQFPPDHVYRTMVYLLRNPNMNSSHVFRADVLHDSSGILKTPREKERSLDSTLKTDLGADSGLDVACLSNGTDASASASEPEDEVKPLPAREVPGFRLTRTVVRRFIPRNPRLDRHMEQTGHFYEKVVGSSSSGHGDSTTARCVLLIYTPHAQSKDDLPWYHPMLRSLAFSYDFQYDTTPSRMGTGTGGETGTGTMSIHFIPYDAEPIPTRLERTLLALLNTQIRLSRTYKPTDLPEGTNFNPSKDNIIPQHLIQNTYSRLKFQYAPDLCRRWVEDTEPSKHVFEDLSITAFLIELWRMMYGVVPIAEKQGAQGTTSNNDNDNFPGFVDVACGNGVLVYVLLMEGYRGWGFDARRRKTWTIFPESVQECLKEFICIPTPFADATIASSNEGTTTTTFNLDVERQTGNFPKDTFIISNHADELTIWTPLMAAMSCRESPLPFLAIPCCSHSLSGAKRRYPPPPTTIKRKDKSNRPKPAANNNESEPPTSNKNTDDEQHDNEHEHEPNENPQPTSGDLKALRAEKLPPPNTNTNTTNNTTTSEYGNGNENINSMYGSLTAKTMSVAEELGYEVEKTILRIPSTRNMGIVGGRRGVMKAWRGRKREQEQRQERERERERGRSNSSVDDTSADDTITLEKVGHIVSRECARDGGVENAARFWVERACGIHRGSAKGH